MVEAHFSFPNLASDAHFEFEEMRVWCQRFPSATCEYGNGLGSIEAGKAVFRPKLAGAREVDPVAYRLSCPKPVLIFARNATNMTTFMLSGDSMRVVLPTVVGDMQVRSAMMHSEAASVALICDRVRLETEHV